jgi:hypothetical protein
VHRLIDFLIRTTSEEAGNTYSFLTDEEQDIAREIKDTSVDTAQITERIGHLVFGDIYDKKKYRYQIYDFHMISMLMEQANRFCYWRNEAEHYVYCNR